MIRDGIHYQEGVQLRRGGSNSLTACGRNLNASGSIEGIQQGSLFPPNRCVMA